MHTVLIQMLFKCQSQGTNLIFRLQAYCSYTNITADNWFRVLFNFYITNKKKNIENIIDKHEPCIDSK